MHCFFTNPAGAGTFEITDTKLYNTVVSLSSQDNAKLLDQLTSGFENKYQSRLPMQVQNYYLDYVIDPNFQRINRLFLSSLADDTIRTVHTEYLLPKLEIKDYNIVDRPNVINQTVQNNIRTFEKT